MSQYDHQQQAPAAYPPPVTAYPAQPPYPLVEVNLQGQGPYVAPPPPMGYPTKGDPAVDPQHTAPAETTTRGDGFWKGCCAALCCCWVLDFCCC
ncbi:hypothetical protein CJ030_MR4G014266 [Morella rubra]|uniref:Cysteine-rich transmembrane domain-containing protein n=1 Tax=Morella rubra TaxID=262757 RepID=A0A6A1UPA5_9ROSI|nr:hypothetical protein CJ030_MR8G004268 [Morella rubra]KAB1216880.1 hypothetical protein CJ030_MR4G014266 [Morella rubra]